MKIIFGIIFFYLSAVCIGMLNATTHLTYEEINRAYPSMKINDPSAVVYFFPFNIWISGITVYNKVFMFDAYYSPAMLAERTCILEHEYHHVRQYREGNFFYRYFIYYTQVPWSSWSIDNNTGNPMEREALFKEGVCASEKKVIMVP
jgi:hypothetical protein